MANSTKFEENLQMNRVALSQVAPSNDTKTFNLVSISLCLFDCKHSYTANSKIFVLNRYTLRSLMSH